MRQSGFLFVACSIFAINVAAEDQTIIIHAGTLLATPGEAAQAHQSIVIKGGVTYLTNQEHQNWKRTSRHRCHKQQYVLSM